MDCNYAQLCVDIRNPDCYLYFADKSLKQLFDQTVEEAYQQSIQVQEQEEPEEDMEQEEENGMCMEM